MRVCGDPPAGPNSAGTGWRGWLRSPTGGITRRHMSLLLAVGTAGAVAGSMRLAGGPEPLTAAGAVRFVHDAGDQLLDVLNGPDFQPEKRRKLRVLVKEKIDIAGVARVSLGRVWRSANQSQRDECERLFASILIADLEQVLGASPGISFSVDRGMPRDEEVEVWTTVFTPGSAPHAVGWLVGMVDGTTRIVDIIGEGTSLRINQRNQVAHFLADHDQSIDALIEALRQEAAES